MEFCPYRSDWKALGKQVAESFGVDNEGDLAALMISKNMFSNPIALRHAIFIRNWRANGSPYYNVYPSIIPPLSSISLDFPGDRVSKPSGLDDIHLRLPLHMNNCMTDGDMTVRSLFVSFQPVNRKPGPAQLENGMCVGIDTGEEDDNGGVVYTLKIFPLDERNVSGVIDSLPDHESCLEGEQITYNLLRKCVNLAIAVCMINDDESILHPEVLARDKRKVNDENIDRLVDKARRRGKFCFSLGKNVEVTPHMRRPHPALVWTGPGRKVPKIIFRKGSIVHRNVIEKMPTGFECEMK